MYDTIEAYTQNKLSTEEKLAFEEKLEANDELFKEVEMHKLTNDILIEQRIAGVREIMNERNSSGTNGLKYILGLFFVVIVSLSAGLFIVFDTEKVSVEGNQNHVTERFPKVHLDNSITDEAKLTQVDVITIEQSTEGSEGSLGVSEETLETMEQMVQNIIKSSGHLIVDDTLFVN